MQNFIIKSMFCFMLSGLCTHMAYTQTNQAFRDNLIAGNINVPDRDIPVVTASQSGIAITGTVKDQQGVPLPGVNVFVQGSTIGVVTDQNGNFKLKAPDEDATLVFSFIGYVTQKHVISNQRSFNIILAEDTKEIEEIVVVGYGTMKKSEVTGSIAQVRAEDFQNTPVTSMEGALQGRASGVTVTAMSGSPGAGISVRIRGTGTVNKANEPLYIVDGMPVETIDYLNPSDIQSIEILKDAASAAIYGSRASNGVVLVTTKRGNSSDDFTTRVEIDAYYGWQTLPNIPNMLDAAGFMELNRRANVNAGTPNSLSKDFQDPQKMLDIVERTTGSRSGTRWTDHTFRTGTMQNINLSASGGNRKLAFATSVGYRNHEGIITYTDFRRYTLRMNVDAQLTKRLKMAANLGLNHDTRHWTEENALENGTIFTSLTYDPITPVYRDGYIGLPGYENDLKGYDPNDPYSVFASSRYTNKRQPLAHAMREGGAKEFSRLRTVSNVVLTYQFFDWLSFSTNIGVELNRRNRDMFTPKYYLDPDEKSDISTMENASNKNTNWIWENTLSFNKRFDAHSVSAVVGITAEEWNWTWYTASKDGIPSNDENMWVIDAGVSGAKSTGNKGSRALQGMLARVNYAYADKYLVSASVRRDASSKFLKENRVGVFPSVSAGWRFSEESFWKNASFNKWFTSGKFRASYGSIGNQAPVNDYAFLNRISGGNDRKYIFGQPLAQQQGYAVTNVGNPNIKWETSTQVDIGLDLTFFGGRMHATLDYFDKRTNDMLLQVPLVNHLGYPSTPWSNAGKVKNYGFEIEVGYHFANKSEFAFDVSGNASFIRNKVLSLGDMQALIGGNERLGDVTYTQVGGPIGEFYGWKTDGIFQNAGEVDDHPMKANGARPGDLRFKDVDGNNAVDDNDRVSLGSAFPTVSYGFNLNAQYKIFDLNLFWQGVAGNKIFRIFKYYTHQNTGFFNAPADILDISWRAPGELGPNDPGNPTNEMFQINATPNWNTKPSDFYVENGSYLRLKNIQLGVTLPKLWSEKIGIQRMRVYVGAQNLLTFTKYEGLDPELAGNGDGEDDPTNFGIDRSHYPQPRTITCGINVVF